METKRTFLGQFFGYHRDAAYARHMSCKQWCAWKATEQKAGRAAGHFFNSQEQCMRRCADLKQYLIYISTGDR